MICRDLDVATKVARSDSLDCITLEGILYSPKFLYLFNIKGRSPKISDHPVFVLLSLFVGIF